MATLPPLAPETIFSIGSFSVTNTYINSTLTVVFFLVLGLILRPKIKDVPTGIQNFFEMIIEAMFKYADQVTGSRKKSMAMLPIIGALFLFILFSNWLGVFPGIGSIGIHKATEHGVEFLPLFRPANTDLNMTMAMALFGIIAANVIGIATIGFWKYFNKFIKISDLISAFKSLRPVNVFKAIVEFGVGLIEIISEISKILSLSLRLFGNVFAGEVLLTVLAGLIAFFIPLPFIALEILVGFIQAMVFAMLVLVYISVATTMPAHEESH